MNKRISVLIADDNEDFGNLLGDYMSQDRELAVVGIARDGLQAVKMIEVFSPDVVILDIIMPNLDGIGVLEKMAGKRDSDRPAIIMLTAVSQDTFIKKAMALGAEYYMMKPFDMQSLIRRIKQVHDDKFGPVMGSVLQEPVSQEQKPIVLSNERKITELLHHIGLLPHMIGFHYIREAALLSLEGEMPSFLMSKQLYPTVAARFGTTPKKVEKAIRNIVEYAWEKVDREKLGLLFENMDDLAGKPNNFEFIARIVDKINTAPVSR